MTRPPLAAHAHAGAQLDHATMRAQAKDALVQLGFKRAEAASGVEAASQHLGPDITLERLIREASPPRATGLAHPEAIINRWPRSRSTTRPCARRPTPPWSARVQSEPPP